MATQKVYMVIGGGGFLGRYIVDFLLNRGEKNVKIFDLRKTFDDPRVDYILGDITKVDDLKKAFVGVQCVIHTASSTHNVHNHDLVFKINVQGTKNVIEACVASGVKELVYTSSASVVFDGNDLKNATEEAPYAKAHFDDYSHTKQLAEEAVIAANGKGGLMTVAIRPSGIFGPRDVQAWPGFLGAAKDGANKFAINGNNYFDWTYVENVAYGHVLASDKLTQGSKVGGQVYNITNDEPEKFWNMAIYVFKSFGYSEPKYYLPYLPLYYFALVFGFVCNLLGLKLKFLETFTPLRICNAGATRTFSCEKAKRELGYKPIVSLDEGKKRTLEYFQQLRKEGKI
mmetsp:Transcript_8293/g.11419  ORF Transcript_8293/g.11419 Transcript_8293/m.11419 type:complete len:342 (+) Transcript_8293:21-1046(+)